MRSQSDRIISHRVLTIEELEKRVVRPKLVPIKYVIELNIGFNTTLHYKRRDLSLFNFSEVYTILEE